MERVKEKCANCSNCFTDEQKKALRKLRWNKQQIDFVENSIVESKIKRLISKL